MVISLSLSISVFCFSLSRLASLITSKMCCPRSSSGGLIVDPLGAQGFPIWCIIVVVPFHSSCHHLASLVIVEFPLSRLTSLITSCICGPSSSPGGLIVDPLGAQGFPYGVSLSWFLFIHLVIILHLLSSFNFPCHV
jgi:hypothetical protein